MRYSPIISFNKVDIRVVQKTQKTFLWGIIRSTENFKFLVGQEVLPLDSKNIQRKNQDTGYFTFWAYKQFCRISKKVCCITEVLTLLLTH